ncbi:MAG: class I SAM-dependent methyltransferase [Planctomycetota bacterium]|nr:MAG: class I SAM-dependent methyltransferase [Planctomycetota bacterium]
MCNSNVWATSAPTMITVRIVPCSIVPPLYATLGQRPKAHREMSHRRWHIGSLPRYRGARYGGPPGGPVLVALRQWLAERRARRLGQRFRSNHNSDALAAYSAMSPGIFRGINARQAWANWQVIPRCLHGRALARPLRVLDLACGDGASSRALAYHLPPGSQVIGLEYAHKLVHRARQQLPQYQSALPTTLHFQQASILEPFVDETGQPIANASVDWVTCCGALAHHFTPADINRIATECARVLQDGAWASVDARSTLTTDPVRQAFTHQGFTYTGEERSCLLDRYPLLCMRKHAKGFASSI